MEGVEVHKGISAVIVVMVGLLGIAGCGSDDSSISKTEYDQQLELVCNKGLQEREEVLKEISEEFKQRNPKISAKEEAQEQAANIKRLMTVYRGTTEEIAEIGAPDEGGKMAEEFVKAREDAAGKVEADPRSALEASTSVFAKASKIAEDFDVPSCAK
jgi:membrane protein involved in colicin uptake